MSKKKLGELEEMLLLCACGLGENASSVGIQERLRSDVARKVALGAIYSTFDRMERKGLVRSRLGAPTPVRGGRRRRLYRVTAKGRRALEETRAARQVLWARVEAEATS